MIFSIFDSGCAVVLPLVLIRRLHCETRDATETLCIINEFVERRESSLEETLGVGNLGMVDNCHHRIAKQDGRDATQRQRFRVFDYCIPMPFNVVAVRLRYRQRTVQVECGFTCRRSLNQHFAIDTHERSYTVTNPNKS